MKEALAARLRASGYESVFDAVDVVVLEVADAMDAAGYTGPAAKEFRTSAARIRARASE